MTRTLYCLAVSPWSEKARWALDHHHLDYDAVEHLPMLSEPWLRLRSGQPRRRITVPMLFDGKQVLRDSLEIARHADRIGQGATLFGDERAVLRVDDLVDRFMQLGRLRALARLREDRAALEESLPPPMRLAPAAFVPVARMITDHLSRKYGGDALAPAESEATMTALLDQLEGLRDGREHVVGDGFSFADIGLACAVGFIAPHATAKLGPANRRVFSDPKIAAAYPALLAWRDRIVEAHRSPR